MLLFVHVPEQKHDVPAAPNSVFFFLIIGSQPVRGKQNKLCTG
jgi:hypothetical protein